MRLCSTYIPCSYIAYSYSYDFILTNVLTQTASTNSLLPTCDSKVTSGYTKLFEFIIIIIIIHVHITLFECIIWRMYMYTQWEVPKMVNVCSVHGEPALPRIPLDLPLADGLSLGGRGSSVRVGVWNGCLQAATPLWVLCTCKETRGYAFNAIVKGLRMSL